MKLKIALLISLSIALPALMVFIVPRAYLNSRTIWVPDNYKTIQEAVNAAGDGDTIRVRASDYPENVVIEGKYNISLIGDDTSTTTIKGIACSPDG